MTLTGANLIAGEQHRDGTTTTRSVDPRSGDEFGPEFHDATAAEVDAAVSAAAAAAAPFSKAGPETVANLLDEIASRIERLGDELLTLADRESGLGSPRLTGERARTCGQLRAFAQMVRDGDHLDVRIDTPDPNATPPRPDLRRTRVAVGPVAVFGASNFPLAFSVAGGDTASALAAGCPVVVKAHPSHPGTSELVGRAITDAVASVGLPAGVFSLVHGRDVAVSQALVTAPGIRAVGFTGSLTAGRALYDLGASRPDPIPVYAELGSLNPQVVTQRAIAERGDALAEGLVGSVTMGTGQFCTKPGIVLIPAGDAGRRFERQVAAAASAVDAGPLLNAGIAANLADQLERTTTLPGVDILVAPDDDADPGAGFVAQPTILGVDAETFLATPELADEHFGPVAVLVRVDKAEDVRRVLTTIPGALAAGIHGTDDDVDEADDLFATLQAIAGRVTWNAFPTGVAVAPAMHHGGPWPATTAPLHTSVGTAAIERFLRPICLQDAPAALLPPELADDNPRGILRLVNGRYTRDPIGA